MRYAISGRHIDVGDALKEHVEKHLGAVTAKYAERPTEANVTFSREKKEFSCEITVHLSTGMNAQAKTHAFDIYAAFDTCRAKMEEQLRRYKRRLKNHHDDRTTPIESFEASSYILASPDEGLEPEEPDSLQPVVIAELETRIPSLVVGEAVMQMELAHSQLLVFRNQAHGGVNVVYRRDDGNIGWIDPSP